MNGSAFPFAFTWVEYKVIIIHSIFVANFAGMLDCLLFLVTEASLLPRGMPMLSNFGDSIKVLSHNKLHFAQLHLHSRHQMLAETTLPQIIALLLVFNLKGFVLANHIVRILDRLDYFDLYC